MGAFRNLIRKSSGGGYRNAGDPEGFSFENFKKIFFEEQFEK